MCGIVAATASDNIIPFLISGLETLEYRGYDSAGIGYFDDDGIKRTRVRGRVSQLAAAVQEENSCASVGIAHTRWATHGSPCERNAHPHGTPELMLVHNGIIENYQELRARFSNFPYTSETDTETLVALISYLMQQNLSPIAILESLEQHLHGAYALAILFHNEPDKVYFIRKGSPLIVGKGPQGFYLASDVLALVNRTSHFAGISDQCYGYIAAETMQLYNKNTTKTPELHWLPMDLQAQHITKDPYPFFMLKEIYEQPDAIRQTLIYHQKMKRFEPNILHIELIACGTSYHAAMIAGIWMEKLLNISCSVYYASEFRYLSLAQRPNTLRILISQSGETADTLACLDIHRYPELSTLGICNVPQSSLVREADQTMLTQAGVEIGVASTKAFIAQLTALLLSLERFPQLNDADRVLLETKQQQLPGLLELAIAQEPLAKEFAYHIAESKSCLFIGRGLMYPIALEGALKLKELSYIHAEAYPAGELKHGPLALIDENMPTVALAPYDALFEKTLNNIQEIHSRGGPLFILTDAKGQKYFKEHPFCMVLPETDFFSSPFVYTVPLQCLAYHVATLKNLDVDKPRNLAKSVTVE